MHTYDLSARPNACRARNCPGKTMDGQDYCARCREEMSGTDCPFRALLADLFPFVPSLWQTARTRWELYLLRFHCRGFEPTIRTPEQNQKRQKKAVNDTLVIVLVLPAVIVLMAFLWPTICAVIDGAFPFSVGHAMASYGAQGWEAGR